MVLMTRKYEIVYIFDSALEESEIDQILDTLHQVLETPSSPQPVTATSHWGKRTLAYEVKGKPVGYYVVARLDTEPSALTEFERRIKLEARVLRYLIVVDEGFKPLLTPAEADAAAAAAAQANTDRPAAAEAKPAAAEAKPADAEAKPADAEAKPAEAEAKPTAAGAKEDK